VSARIARGAPARSKAKPPARGGKGRKPPPGLLEGLPVAEATIRRIGTWILLLMLFALALAIAVAMRLPQAAGTAIGEAVGRAGFAVNGYEIKGLKRMARLPVARIADRQIGRAMPLADLEGTRRELLRFGWIKDARVSRRLPDRLVIDIVERRPAAIWQQDQELSLIDADGVVLAPVRLEAMPDLPLLIGPQARGRVAELKTMLEAAPRLKPIMAGATWIGGRRWDLRFQSGETLALPEGLAKSTKALIKFADMDGKRQLLGRGFARFDMRLPGKMYIRLSNEPGSVVPDLPPEPPAPGSGTLDPATTI